MLPLSNIAAFHAAGNRNLQLVNFHNTVAAARQGGADIDHQLLRAAADGRADMVAALLRAGAHVDFRTERGGSALMAAAGHGHTAVIDALLLRNADIDAADDRGWTATMHAVANRQVDAVIALMGHENDIDADNLDGMSALLMAATCGYADIVEVLLGAGADIHVVDRHSHSAAMLAAANGHIRVIRALQEGGTDIDIDLLLAAGTGTAAMVESLIRAGAHVDAMNNEGMTAMLLAADRGHTDIIAVLRAAQLARGARAAPTRLATVVEEDESHCPMPSEEDTDLESMVAAWTRDGSPVSASTSTTSISPTLELVCGAEEEHARGDAFDGEPVLQWPAGPMAPHEYA